MKWGRTVTDPFSNQIHASCVLIDGQGVLITGPSGSGKSDLALRLIDSGGVLVADDRCNLDKNDDRVLVRCPEAIRGRMEVRGIGIVEMPVADEAEIKLVVDLVGRSEVERMPETGARSVDLLGIPVPRLITHAFDASATAKVRLAIRLASGE